MDDNNMHIRDMLISQFKISWSLLEIHLTNLNDKECFWQPSKKGLHIVKHKDIWYPDWPNTESYEIGPANIAWITWHIIFWWSMANDYSFGNATLTKEDVQWPGSILAAKDRIYNLKKEWIEAINKLQDEEILNSKNSRWPFSDKPFYEIIAWLNIELMKNAAEIGYCRFLYATQQKIDE